MSINTPAELEAKLLELSPILHEKFRLKKIGYFGSFARGEQTYLSDIDILLDEETDNHWEVKEFLEQQIDRKVDVVPKNRLRAEMTPGVLEDVKFFVNDRWQSGFELSGSKERVHRMKKHELYLLDMCDSMKEIADFMNDVDYNSFRNNRLLVIGMQRLLITIGEAANKIPNSVQANYPAFPWGQLVKWRNDLVHEYFGFNTDQTWETIQHDILPNITEMQRIADEECHS
jgi:uncharacterized protein with HEPN domain/predicted nucleotidyltransferase